MFCDNCGNKLRDGAKFCNKCGTPVTEETEVKSEVGQNENAQSGTSSVITQNHSANNEQPQQVVYQAPPKPYYAPGTHPYHRLGGFLMAIVVINYMGGIFALIDIIPVLISFIGLLQVSGMVNSYAPGYTAFVVYTMIGLIILLILSSSIMIGYANRIRRKDTDFLNFIQTGSITLLIITFIYFLVLILWANSFNTYGFMNSSSEIGSLVTIAGTWISGIVINSVYFGCSVRVRTYMGSDDYLRRSVFNKNSHPVPADGSDQVETQQRKTNEAFNPKTQWICPECANINYNYVGTCSCGQVKPSGAKNDVWKCQSCGNINSSSINRCSKCGKHQFDYQTETWICPECGTQNSMSISSCKVCFNKRPNSSDHSVSGSTMPTEPTANEWKCPICGTINANYVGTCGCGQKRP